MHQIWILNLNLKNESNHVNITKKKNLQTIKTK